MEEEDKILKLIKSKKKGILQSELWKLAKIDSRKCSSIVTDLEKKGIITREIDPENKKSKIIKLVQKKNAKKNFKLLIVGKMFSPCTGCAIECVPEKCMDLSEWVSSLIIEISKKAPVK